MTDMDYEKAYKAVLQTATQWIKDGCSDKEKICLECVFPELRESEDERTRKEIRDFILYKAGHLLDEETEHRFVSYLEKQKECVAGSSKTSVSEDEKIRKGLVKLLTVASEAYLVESTGIKKSSYLGWLEKQKEQKCHGCFNRDVVFMRGMKYAKEQMLEEAIEGKVFMSFAPGHNQMVMADVDLPTNTKVRVIVLKDNEDESK